MSLDKVDKNTVKSRCAAPTCHIHNITMRKLKNVVISLCFNVSARCHGEITSTMGVTLVRNSVQVHLHLSLFVQIEVVMLLLCCVSRISNMICHIEKASVYWCSFTPQLHLDVSFSKRMHYR